MLLTLAGRFELPMIRAVFAASALGICLLALPMHAQEIGTVQQLMEGRLLPDMQVRTFRQAEQLAQADVVRAGGPVRLFLPSTRTLDGLVIPSGGRTYDLYDYMSMNRVAGLIVLKGGETVFEDYELGNDEATRWMTMSVAASITSVLVGAAIHDGAIGSIDDRLDKYLPELAGTAYQDVTIRQALLMSSGVKWNERYADATSEHRQLIDAYEAGSREAVQELFASLDRTAEPGKLWNYSTGETHLLASVIRAATASSLSDYLSRKIWQKAGMESDAVWWLDSVNGQELGGTGFSARLRDLARFGQFILEDGVIDGERILPEGWVRAGGTPHEIDGRMVDFGYIWWPVAQNEGFEQDGAFAAIGDFGQYIYVNPRRKVVIAMWGAQSKPEGSWPIDENNFLEAVSRHLD